MRCTDLFLSRSVWRSVASRRAQEQLIRKKLSSSMETMKSHPKSPNGLPPAQGLYDPAHEHDACGIGFVASIGGQKSHDIIEKVIQVLINLTHRGACGCDPETGD